MKLRKSLFRFMWVFSILVGAMLPICYEPFFDKSEVDITLPENWKRMPIPEKLNSLDGLLSKNTAFPPLSQIKQLNIRRQLTKMIVGKEDEVLRDGFNYSFGFRFDMGWKELGLLIVAGFASVWIIYMVIRVVTLLTPSTPMIHFPSPPLGGQVESLNFLMRREPVGLASIRITLFSFLVFEERSQGPRRPSAVWID
ncbi:MAG: hypothetical protein A2157_01395 [Deltaproteobacteria bacterium RBG_16_47_11]|nr:MAG: hypothetical protein A2157_01395 [Deltaproteobacteria bacterium RBG_16_47_11]